MLFLDHERDRRSLWYSTQATARVLDVLAEIALRSPVEASVAGPGSLTVRVDEQAASSVPLPAAAVDGGPIFVPLPGGLSPGAHRVQLGARRDCAVCDGADRDLALPAMAEAGACVGDRQ